LRIYGIISFLAFISLGGFRITRSMISLELSSLGERRARNQKLVILKKIGKAKHDIQANRAQNIKSQNFRVFKTRTFGKG
jgi:hypothetical protein